jgi:hypothetical protein
MKRKVTQLFTAAVLVAGTPIADANPRTLPSGAPACGNVQTKKPRRCTATAPQPEPMQPVPQTAVARNANPRTPQVLQKLLTLFGVKATDADTVAKPRRLRNGSPANGNVARRTSGGERPRQPVEQPTPINNSN